MSCHITLINSSRPTQYSRAGYHQILFIPEWTTSLDTSCRTLFVYVCFCVSIHVTSNVELRTYVISRQIVIERRVT